MWKRMRPKKMYASIFLYSGIAVTLLTLVFALFLTRQFSGSAMDELQKSTQSKLNQIAHSSEFTLQKLRMYALRIYADENIGRWLNASPGNDSPLLLNKAVISMRDIMGSEPYIRAMYLINYQTDQIFSSESGLYTTKDFYDQNVLAYIQNQKLPYLEYFNDNVGGASFLALVVPATAPTQKYNGYVAILIDKQLLNDNVLQASGSDPNKVVIVGKGNEYILGNADAALAAAASNADIGHGQASWEWRYRGVTWSVLSTTLQIEGWKVYHLTPISVWNQKIANIRLQIVGSSVILLLALLVFLFLQSYRSIKPISDLALSMQRKLEKEHVDLGSGEAASEVDWIHSGMNAMLDKIEQLNLSLKSSKSLVKEDFLRQWILSSRPVGPILEFVRNETALLRTGEFRMALIRMDSRYRFEEQYDFASRKLLRFAMANIMKEVLDNCGFAAETVDFGSDHLVALFPVSPDRGIAYACAAMQEAREQISRWLKLEVNAAVSPELGGAENLSIPYSRLYELTWLPFVIGEDRVYTEDDLEIYEQGTAATDEFDEHIVQQLIQSVQLKNEKALEGYLEQLTVHLQSLPYEECRLQLTRAIYSVMKSFKLHESFQGMNSIHTFLDRFATIGEVKGWLHRELLQVIEQQRRKPSTKRKEETSAEMIEYIRNHIHHPMLSVDDVAAHVSMSVNYARQIFKEQFNCSISDFIMGQRIELAKKLLATTDWTVAEIAEQSGFQTKSTFFSAFKKMTGHTPSQYRMEEQ